MQIIFKAPSEKPSALMLFETTHKVSDIVWALDHQGFLCFSGIGDKEQILTRIAAFFPSAALSEIQKGEAHLYEVAERFFNEGDLGEGFPKAICYGTAFQQDVWKALREMPAYERMSYAELAMKVGRPKAVRAVGSAVGANPISPFIPCHRILPKSGGVGQYGWGSALKQSLLESEKTFARNM